MRSLIQIAALQPRSVQIPSSVSRALPHRLPPAGDGRAQKAPRALEPGSSEPAGILGSLAASERIGVEAKFIEDWSESLYNPDLRRVLPPGEVEKTIGQALKYAKDYPAGVAWYTNSLDFVKTYSRNFKDAGVKSFTFTIVPARQDQAMRREPDLEHHPYRHLLVAYDPKNPDPCITPESIRYIESRQPGLTDRDIAKLDEIEWFTFHRQLKTLNAFAIPGLRLSKYTETRYVKRYNAQRYWTMINDFFAYVPPDFSKDQADRCLLPGFRLTCPDGGQFYPVEYSGDFPAWRKRLADNALHFGTSIGYFDHGRFVISDGREIEFADMGVASDDGQRLPPDF